MTDLISRAAAIDALWARLNDRTITGCGIPLYSAGLIRREEIQVEHTVKAAKMEAVKC